MDIFDLTPMVATIICSVLGSSAGFGFIQFLITRKDKKEEDKKKDKTEEFRKEYKDHLTSVNAEWKTQYCDKNAKAINDLIEEVRVGLKDREDTGKKRYDEHHESIEKMSEQHQKDFQILLSTIRKLEDNDTNITKSIEAITKTQENIGNAIIGLAHDKLVYSTDKFIERGAITIKEKATLNSIYEPYLALHGNSYAKQGMEQVAKLPVISDEEAKIMDLQIKRANN